MKTKVPKVRSQAAIEAQQRYYEKNKEKFRHFNKSC